MVAESLGTMQLAWHALNKVTPNVFIDTTGCAFTFFVAKVLAGCKVGTYIHYPTISTVS
jgi:alpha-1,2-mannosyltransferase